MTQLRGLLMNQKMVRDRIGYKGLINRGKGIPSVKSLLKRRRGRGSMNIRSLCLIIRFLLRLYRKKLSEIK